jgi:hypothetical protein
MRDKVILTTAMPTMTVTVLDKFEDFLGDSHALILLVDRWFEILQPLQELIHVVELAGCHSFISACNNFDIVACAMIADSIVRNFVLTRLT